MLMSWWCYKGKYVFEQNLIQIIDQPKILKIRQITPNSQLKKL